MSRDIFGEGLGCFLCDYGLIILALVIVGIVAFLGLDQTKPLFESLPLINSPTPSSSPTLLKTSTPVASATPLPTKTLTATFESTTTSTPTLPQKPEFVIVIVPVNWGQDQDTFEQTGGEHAETFVRESEIETFFDVVVKFADAGLSGVSLSSNDLLYDVVEFGLAEIPGDRYIGLTDGDLAPDGIKWVSGWTNGPGGQGVVVEALYSEITSHELGHTFGLCDEYNYVYWVQQNDEFPDGCPNPYPDDCPQSASEGIVCDGYPTGGGHNSFMGPSGMPGDYGYNSLSLAHLSSVFQALAEQVSP